MTDLTLNAYISRGTATQRTAFTPSTATPSSGPGLLNLWYDTTDGNLYFWTGAAWASPSNFGVQLTGTPAANKLAKWSSASAITNGDLTGDVTTSGSMATTIASAAVSLSKIANAAASSRLLGSGSSGSGAAYTELTLGTGLTMGASSVSADTGTSGAKLPLLNGANTWSAAQTLSALATLSAGADNTPATTPSTTAVGYLGLPQNIQNGAYTTIMLDAGKHLYHTSGSAHTWTIDSNANVAYPIGTTLTFVNESGGGNVTIAITSDTLRWQASTGSRTLAANGTATALKVTATAWRLTGDGIT